MVYVQNKLGQPLMPTEDHRKVRLLLKHRLAVVVRRTPFTIRFTTKSKPYVQPIILGVDADSGYKENRKNIVLHVIRHGLCRCIGVIKRRNRLYNERFVYSI